MELEFAATNNLLLLIVGCFLVGTIGSILLFYIADRIDETRR